MSRGRFNEPLINLVGRKRAIAVRSMEVFLTLIMLYTFLLHSSPPF